MNKALLSHMAALRVCICSVQPIIMKLFRIWWTRLNSIWILHWKWCRAKSHSADLSKRNLVLIRMCTSTGYFLLFFGICTSNSMNDCQHSFHNFHRNDNFLTSMSEFIVQKVTDRHPEPTKRILCLTEATVLERDPQTYSVRMIWSFFIAKRNTFKTNSIIYH